jgi:ATP-dependent protease ClpP protease subunit
MAAPVAEREAPPRLRLTNAEGEAHLYIYAPIDSWGEPYGVSAQNVVDTLRETNAATIHLHINSPGGEVFEALAIYNVLRAHPATVVSHIEGLAASAASFVALAGDKVIISRNAVMMIHDALALAYGNAGELRELADLLDKMSDNIADIYSQKAGGGVEFWRERMRAESWYTGAEAVEAGLADEMTDPDAEPDTEPADPTGVPATTDAWDLSLFAFAGRAAAPAPVLKPEQAEADKPDAGAVLVAWLDDYLVRAPEPWALVWPEPTNDGWDAAVAALKGDHTP